MAKFLTALPLWAIAGGLLLTFALGGAPSAHALVSPGVSTPVASVQAFAPQVTLTLYYSVIGGGGSLLHPVVTYVNGGNAVQATVNSSPSTFSVDSGTTWNITSSLPPGAIGERWQTNQPLSAFMTNSATFSYVYYNQYLESFSYLVKGGGAGYSAPSVSVTQFGQIASVLAGSSAWVDATTGFSFGSLLPGSGSSQQWQIVSGNVTGTVSGPGSARATYYHQYLATASYSVIGGGFSSSITLTGTSFGSSVTPTISSSPQSFWLDTQTSYSITPTLQGALVTERWVGGTLNKTIINHPVFIPRTNGTVTTAFTVSLVYYHQYQLSLEFTFRDGSAAALTQPLVNYTSFGVSKFGAGGTSVWADSGTSFSLPSSVCCAPANERWEGVTPTAGMVTSAATVNASYYHQYDVTATYSMVGTPNSNPPVLKFFSAGQANTLILSAPPQTVWADAGGFSITNPLQGSTGTERWFANGVTGTITGPSLAWTYNHQYLLTVTGAGPQSIWVNAGPSMSFSTPAGFGRVAGVGSRITGYSIDYGTTTNVVPTSANLTIPIVMNGPHTLTLASVRQYQIMMDSSGLKAIAAITPTPIPHDTGYWYDTGTSVQVTLNGVYSRAAGTGERISSFSVNGAPPTTVFTMGTVVALTVASLVSPQSITTTSVVQYEMVLDSVATAALSAITPATLPGDRFWYDSGSTGAMVTLNGVYARSGGTGMRIATWSLDSGPVNKLTTTGTFSVSKTMISAHFLNTTSATQYQVTMDDGAVAALSSLTPPTVAGDTGWYDSSTHVSLVLNEVWGRTAEGTGVRLVSYSVDNSLPTGVFPGASVTVLDAAAISAPLSVTTNTVAQYEVILDSGAQTAVASATSPSLPSDAYWYDSGSPVSMTLDGVWGRTATSGSRLVSFSINLGAPTTVASSSPVTILSLTGISAPQSIVTKVVTQYNLALQSATVSSITPPPIAGDTGWYDSGTTVQAGLSTFIADTGFSRGDIVSYSIDGGTQTPVSRSGPGTISFTVSMSRSHSVAFTTVTQYRLVVTGSSNYAASPASPTHDTYFDAGSKTTVTVPYVTSSKGASRQVVLSYSLDGQPAVPVGTKSSDISLPFPVFTGAHTIALNIQTQYLVNFLVTDGTGATPITPSSLELKSGNSTIDVQNQAGWIANGTRFTTASLIWEGADVKPSGATYSVTAPLNVTLQARAFPATFTVKDLLGIPVSGAQVSISLANGSSVHGTTASDGTYSLGLIPLGQYVGTVTNLGSTVKVLGDASTHANAPVKVLVSSFVLAIPIAIMAIVGAIAAAFIVSRRRRSSGESLG